MASTLYIGIAFLEGYYHEDATRQTSWNPFERYQQQQQQQQQQQSNRLSGPYHILSEYWKGTDSMSKLVAGTIVANGAVALTEKPLPAFWFQLWHNPARNVNYTLLTSAFVHSGMLHLGVNMYALMNFMPMVGHSPLFEGNTYHMSAFYLSTAVLASYGEHFTTLWRRSSRTAMMGGASGALFAVIGAYATLYPQHQMGIIFLPWSFDAQSLLWGMMAFDVVGATIGFKGLHLGHGVSSSDWFLPWVPSYGAL